MPETVPFESREAIRAFHEANASQDPFETVEGLPMDALEGARNIFKKTVEAVSKRLPI